MFFIHRKAAEYNEIAIYYLSYILYPINLLTSININW